MPLITPVILSGGAGTRLWPLSRPSRPKQLLPLFAPETMLQLTAARLSDPARFAPPLFVAGEAHADAIRAQAPRADARLLVEPAGRNTAPAIALAALSCAPDDLLLVSPSDHHVADVRAFHEAIGRAEPAAHDGLLVCFGIHPTHPETGYGYIRRGEAVAPGVHRAEAFVEKPDLPTARAYLHDPRYSWNGGIFLFTAGAYLRALEAHAPAVLLAARAAMAGAVADVGTIRPDAKAWAGAPSISIDYAVMEHAADVAVVPIDMGWSDLGSWDALHALAAATGETDDGNNLLVGDVVAADCHSSLLRGEGVTVAAVGVDNIVVVATPDAVLVLPRGESQRVKEVADLLAARGHPSIAG